MTRRVRTILKILVSCILIWPLVAWAGARLLITEAPLEKADAIVVLAGAASYRERTREAVRLLQSTSQIALRRDRRAQMPKSSLSVRPVEAIDCALARSSSLFLGVEKPWPVPL